MKNFVMVFDAAMILGVFGSIVLLIALSYLFGVFGYSGPLSIILIGICCIGLYAFYDEGRVQGELKNTHRYGVSDYISIGILIAFFIILWFVTPWVVTVTIFKPILGREVPHPSKYPYNYPDNYFSDKFFEANAHLNRLHDGVIVTIMIVSMAVYLVVCLLAYFKGREKGKWGNDNCVIPPIHD
jgi:hypothetical protein